MNATAEAIRGRVGSHVRVPMFRDGYALVLSGMVTAVLGVAYWVVAAHRYSAADVGLNSAAISAMMLIAGIAQLNLSSALVRFVPVAGKTTFRLVLFSYLTSVAVAGVLGAVFLLAGRQVLPSLGLVDETTALAVLFVGSTLTWCVFVLQDAVLTGLRQAVWVPVENASFSLVKLVLLVAFASAFPRHGIFSSWAIAAVVTLVPISVLIFTRLVPRHLAAARATEAPPSLGDLTRFVAPDYVGALGWLSAVTVIPLIVTERIGPTQNAYFALAWVIVLPIFFVSASMGSSLVVSGASDPELLPSHLRRMLRQTALLVVPMVAVVEVSAPYLLRIFGAAYSQHGTIVLRLLALAAVPNILFTLAIMVARVRRRMATVVAIQAAGCIGVLALTWILLGRYGIDGVGWAWLIAQTTVAVGVAVWVLPRLLRPGRGSRLIPVLGRCRGAIDGRRKLRALRPVLAEILDRLDATGASPHLGRLLARPASDSIVVVAGPPHVAIKLAHTEAGSRSLKRELEVIRTLTEEPRLAGWRGLLPTVVASGEAGGHTYLVERVTPGVDGRRLPRARVQAHAAASIGELHRLTATQRVVDERLLERWVDKPLRVLESVVEADGLGPVRSRLHESLAGRTLSLSWTHGDFVPGNVLVAADGSCVTGIVDWESAMPDDLPVLDLLQLVLATRLLAGGHELGSVVAPLLNGTRLDAAEESLLAEAQEALPGDPIDLRAAILLCWLRHVSANLEKSTHYGSSRAWLGANVTAVLRKVAR